MNELASRTGMCPVYGELKLHEAVFSVQRKTRNYAKRQLTRWRKEPNSVWLRGFGDAPAIVEQAVAKVRACKVTVVPVVPRSPMTRIL